MADSLTWRPAWRIRELIERREVSCREVTDPFLGRIEPLNPTLRAFAELFAPADGGSGEAAGFRTDAMRISPALDAKAATSLWRAIAPVKTRA